MTTLGIIGAGEVGSQIARAAIAQGYEVVIANSRGPETLTALIRELGPSARAATARDAAAAGDVVVIAVPLKLINDMPVAEVAGKVVIDTNNYIRPRDGAFADVDAGRLTVHQLRQQHLPGARVVSGFTHIQAPTLLAFARPAGAPDRLALAVSSDFPDAVAVLTQLQDEFGFDTVDNSPLSQSWRVGPGTPAWQTSLRGGQRKESLAQEIAAARRVVVPTS